MLAYQQKETTASVAAIMENTILSKRKQVSEIMRQMLTQAQTAAQYFTNDQIKERTRKVSADVDLFCFFFQAEDGIRDHCVTGVQTCALPISAHRRRLPARWRHRPRGAHRGRQAAGARGLARGGGEQARRGRPPVGPVCEERAGLPADRKSVV